MLDTVLEYFGVVTGLLYLLLEIRQHRGMWIVGFITSLVYVFVFFFARIYADMGLSIYYTLISIYGFRQWALGNKYPTEESGMNEMILYRHINKKFGIKIFLALLLIYICIYYILIHFTDSPVPAGDAFTTTIGIIATWMLARRIIEHWIFWVVANIVSIYIYYLRDLYPTMFLYFCYAVLAIVGWYTWKKKGVIINGDAV